MVEGSGRSLFVSGTALNADVRWFEVALVAIFVIAVAWLLSMLLASGIESLIEQAHKPRMLAREIRIRHDFLTKISKRREKLLAIFRTKDGEVNTIKQVKGIVQQKIRKLKQSSDQLVRQLGEENDDNRRYRFVVANRYVADYVAKGQKHPMLDDAWQRGQLVEVFARSLIEARVAISERYSASLGYFAEEIKDGPATHIKGEGDASAVEAG